MKKIFSLSFLFLLSFSTYAQENILWEADFWKENPNISEVKKQIKNGNDPVTGNASSFDATTYAILNNAPLETIKYLLNLEGNSVNKVTHDERTYLFWAAYKENLPLVKYLFENGAKGNVYDNRSYSPIMFAARSGITNAKLYDMLIDNGVAVDYANPKGVNVLLVLAGSVEDVQDLDYFTNKGLSLKHTDEQGKNMIDYAAATGNKTLIQQLIKKGLEYKDTNKDGTNALLMTTQPTRGEGNSLAFFKYLVDLGVDATQKDHEQKNLYHYLAANNKHKDVLAFFTEFNINKSALDANKNTPLMLAAARNKLENVKWFAQHSKDINRKNNEGQSALSLAVANNTAEVVDFLLKNDADAKVKDTTGNNLAAYLVKSYSSRNAEDFNKKWDLIQQTDVNFTALQESDNTLFHYAAEKEDLGLFKKIKESGININAQNNEGLTALHKTALTAKDTNLLKALIEMGADKNLKTEFEENAYDLASENELLDDDEIEFLK